MSFATPPGAGVVGPGVSARGTSTKRPWPGHAWDEPSPSPEPAATTTAVYGGCNLCEGPHETLASDSTGAVIAGYMDLAVGAQAQLRKLCAGDRCWQPAASTHLPDPLDAGRLHSSCRSRIEPFAIGTDTLAKHPRFHLCWDADRVLHMLGVTSGGTTPPQRFRLCEGCMAGLGDLFAVLRKVRSVDSQLALRRHLAEHVWPHAPPTRVSHLREQLFLPPFNVRAPEDLTGFTRSQCNQLLTRLDGVLEELGEEVMTPIEKKAVTDAMTSKAVVPGSSSSFISDSRMDAVARSMGALSVSGRR